MYFVYLINEFHNLSWITEINEFFHDILIYWDAPVCKFSMTLRQLMLKRKSTQSCAVSKWANTKLLRNINCSYMHAYLSFTEILHLKNIGGLIFFTYFKMTLCVIWKITSSWAINVAIFVFKWIPNTTNCSSPQPYTEGTCFILRSKTGFSTI